jgi:hypothetical protein
MVLRFRTTETAQTIVELHTPAVGTTTHPSSVEVNRPPRIVYPDENREEIIMTIEISVPGVNTTISPRYPELEQEMAQFMPAVQSIEHVDLHSALEIEYQATANVVIAGYQGVTCLCLNFDRRGNGIPSELHAIRWVNEPDF